MGFFDDIYYIQGKLKQLAAENATDANGQPYNVYTLRAAISNAGMTPEEHYKQYGEGENLNPNPYFNQAEYLEAKQAQLASHGEVYTLDSLKAAIANGGMTIAEHYEKFGSKETTADGHLLNPSNAFDANAYPAAKLAQLQSPDNPNAAERAAWEGKSVADLVAVLNEAGISPVTHYIDFGAGEATTTKIPLVQTVPSEQRVANDPAREAFQEVVPTNYNPATAAPADAKAAPVTKPADVAQKVDPSVSPKPIVPASSAPVPGDDGYVAPPANIKDTVANPVIPPSSTDATKATGNWMVVNPSSNTATVVGQDGSIKGEVKVDFTPDASGNTTVTVPPSQDVTVDKLPPASHVPPSVTPGGGTTDNVPPTGGGSTGGGSTGGGGGAVTTTFTATVEDTTLTFGGTATGDISIDGTLAAAVFTRGAIEAAAVNLTGVTGATPPNGTHFVTIKNVFDLVEGTLANKTTIIADTEAVVKGLIDANGSLNTKIAGFDVTGDNAISLTVAQAGTVAGLKFADDDVISITDTGANLAGATFADLTIAALGGTSVTLDASDNTVSLAVAQAGTLGGLKFAATDNLSITGIANDNETAALTAYTTTLLGGNTVRLDATDNAWNITTAELTTALADKILFNNVSGATDVDTVFVGGFVSGGEFDLSAWAAGDASGDYTEIGTNAASVAAGTVFFDSSSAVLTYWDVVANKAAAITLTGVTDIAIDNAGMVTVTV